MARIRSRSTKMVSTAPPQFLPFGHDDSKFPSSVPIKLSSIEPRKHLPRQNERRTALSNLIIEIRYHKPLKLGQRILKHEWSIIKPWRGIYWAFAIGSVITFEFITYRTVIRRTRRACIIRLRGDGTYSSCLIIKFLDVRLISKP